MEKKYILVKTYPDGDQAVSNPKSIGDDFHIPIREGDNVKYYEFDLSRLKEVTFDTVVKEV